MRTNLRSILTLFVFLLVSLTAGHAQKKTLYDKYLDEVEAAFNAMINNAVEVEKETDCEISQLMGKDAIPGRGDVADFAQAATAFATPGSAVDNNIDRGIFPGNMDAALYAIGNQNTFQKWTEYLIKKKIDELSKGEYKEFKRYYDRLKYLQSWYASDKKKTLEKGACKMVAEYFVKVNRYSYPKIYWDMKAVITIECDCKKEPDKFEMAVYEYTGSTIGKVTTGKPFVWSFGKAVTDPELELKKYKCCPKAEENEESGMHIPQDEEPSYYVGVGGGFGFRDNFNETNYCFTAEYIHHVADIGNSDLFIGGGGGYETASYSDFKQDGFMVGVTGETFTPINNEGSLLWTNSISGYYSFGDRDQGGFQATYSGIDAVLRTGLSFKIGSATLIGIEVPIVTWTNRTFKDDLGMEVEGIYEGGEDNSSKSDGFNFLLDNGQQVKVNFRFNLQ